MLKRVYVTGKIKLDVMNFMQLFLVSLTLGVCKIFISNAFNYGVLIMYCKGKYTFRFIFYETFFAS